MHIEYGPPAARGVGHIQYLSGDDGTEAPSKITVYVQPAAMAAAIVWGLADSWNEKSIAKGAKYATLGLSALTLFLGLRSR